MRALRGNVLLDLDGTLTDSRPGIIACLKHALASQGEAAPDDVDLQRFIGPPLRNTFAHLLRCELDADCVAAAIDAYRERFTASGMFENAVYEGVPEALDRLSAQGCRLYLATSKPRVFAQQILEHFALDARFEAIYGSELDGSLCEKHELIEHALSASNLDCNDTIMIGDREHDVRGAIHNSVIPVGVLWGYGSRDELTRAGAQTFLSTSSELANAPSLVARTFGPELT